MPQVILIAGFGNLGAKLLPLKWAFPFMRFLILENYWGDNDSGYYGAKRAFENAGTVGDLLGSETEALSSSSTAMINLLAFRDASRAVRRDHPENSHQDEHKSLAEIFAHHVYYCGSLEEHPHEQPRYKQLIKELIGLDKSEVLLYLATRPEDYLWYLQRYAHFASRVAVDKPLAKDPEQLNNLIRFSRLNPKLEIRPIDHYLFKLDFADFNQFIEERPDALKPKDIDKIEVVIHEPGLDEHRPYFIQTGIIRDMMPHVAAMLRYMFRQSEQFTGYVGNVLPIVHKYQSQTNGTVVQAAIDVNYWTGDCYVLTKIRIAKGMPDATKEIVIHYNTGGGQRRIDLTRKPEPGDEVPVDWEGALTYLMEARPLAKSVKSHFTFSRACEITREVLVCHKQANAKIAAESEGRGKTFFEYSEGQNLLTSGDLSDKKVFVLNFDGVIVNTELAHKRAWNTWHKLLGARKLFAEVARDPTEADPPEWFEPGKSNQEMINRALRFLSKAGHIDSSLEIVFSTKCYDLFSHILRSEKINLLSSTCLQDGSAETIAGEDRDTANVSAQELAWLREYHNGVLKFLEELRRRNCVLVVESTNLPLLVQQSLDVLLKKEGEVNDNVFTGFCRYFVGELDGFDVYMKIVKEYKDYGGIIIFDDYTKVVKRVEAEAAAKNINDKVRIVHMHTSARPCSDCGNGYNNFNDVLKDLSDLLGESADLSGQAP